MRAPASIANLGPGFDILALAIEGLYDTVRITARSGSGLVRVASIGYGVPSGEGNSAYAVAREFISKHGIKNYDIYVEVHKGIPPSCGLGSSGATSAAVAYALTKLFDLDLDSSEILYLAGVGEQHVAGSLHYDNVAASLFGGVVVVNPETREVLRYYPKIAIPLAIIVPVVPELQRARKTEYARSLLPRYIDLRTHVNQSSALAKLIYALLKDDLELLGKAISVDHIAEPSRSRIIPFYWELKELALKHGALGFNICGAGPAVFFVHRNSTELRKLAELLVGFLESKGIEVYAHTSSVFEKGVEVLGEVREEG